MPAKPSKIGGHAAPAKAAHSKSAVPDAKKAGGGKTSAEPVDSRDPFGHFAFEFERIDKNKDGWLSSAELHHGLLSAGWEQDEVCGLFELIDTNKDGKITKEEFISYRATQKTKSMALNPKEVFSNLDEDKDNALSLRELAKLIKDVNEREGFLYDHDVGPYIKNEFATADTDGDKKLSVEEFLPWYDRFIKHVEDCREKCENEQRGGDDRHKGPEKPLAGVSAQFSGDGLWDCPLQRLPEALECSWAKRKTPLLIDATDPERNSGSSSALETFLTYGGGAGSAGFELLEMKRMVVEVNMTKVKTLQEHLVNCRQKLVNAMKYGRVLTILLANSCPPLKSKFTAPDFYPLDVFDSEKVHAVRGQAQLAGTFAQQVIRKEDDCHVVREEFNVLVVTKFSAEDYAEFLGDELPLALHQPIRVTC